MHPLTWQWELPDVDLVSKHHGYISSSLGGCSNSESFKIIDITFYLDKEFLSLNVNYIGLM